LPRIKALEEKIGAGGTDN